MKKVSLVGLILGVIVGAIAGLLSGSWIFWLGAGLAIGVWALASGSGTKSPKGPCVSVVIASSTGGGMVRQCGTDAHSWCATEATGTGPEAREVVAQCRRAGLLAQPPGQ